MKYKMLFVYAHPDDETLWTGGTLAGFSKFEDIETHVLVISGRNDHRYTEFCEAMKVIGPSKYHVGNHELAKQGGIPLENIEKHTLDGVNAMGMNFKDFDIVITHPYYGDEHAHIQHKMLYYEMGNMCKRESVPFGCFTFMPIPHVRLTPCLFEGKRGNGLHLMNMSTCEKLESDKTKGMNYDPKYFIEYKVEEKTKKAALKCFNSIDLENHQKNYSAWDSYIENYYIFDKKGLAPFLHIQNQMEKPSRHILYL